MNLFINDPTPVSGGAMVDVVHPDGTHVYWSTHCRHGRHDACAATELAPGVPRQPSQCKTCAAPCVCPCGHGLSGPGGRPAGEGRLLVPEGVDFTNRPGPGSALTAEAIAADFPALPENAPCGPACECRGAL